LIETDKATIDFEVTDEIFIAKIMKSENDGKIQVGDVIAYGVDK
jgi:pyruvate/2-oxoglutarate dehydrogenase complex dihydrolipoamide acyltransferase (E2) component